ncbi:MAG: hypothetical protein WA364_27310 [Candidatus Nitrosopolaris sp.]
MSRVYIVDSNDSIKTAINEMAQHALDNLVVVESHHDDKDYFLLELADIKPEDVESDKKVKDISLHHVSVTESGRPIAAIYPQLKENPAVIVKEGTELKGIITMDDYLKKDNVKGIKDVSFRPEDDFLDESGRRVFDVLMKRGTIPGDKYLGQGQRWFIELDIEPGTSNYDQIMVYFKMDDAKTFKENVELSLKEPQTIKKFPAKDIVVNPGDHQIDNVTIGFENGVTRIWYVLLKAPEHTTSIYSSERDAKTFRSKIEESLADVK